MNPILKDAYIKIKGIEPESDMKDWQLAEAVVNDFKIRDMGEELAKKVIFQIVNHVLDYPDKETTERIIGRAEGFASELFPELSNEPHMDELLFLEHLEQNKKLK